MKEFSNFVGVLEDDVDSLVFHTKCGTHVAVTNNNRTAYRPKYVVRFICDTA